MLRLSDEKRQLAKAMLDAGRRVYEVSKALEISRPTVYRIMNEQADEDVEALAMDIRKNLASKYLVLADTILMGIDDEAMDDASLKDKAIAAAIFTDKAARLMKLGFGAQEPEREAQAVGAAGTGEQCGR